MNFKNIMLSLKKVMQKRTYGMILFIFNWGDRLTGKELPEVLVMLCILKGV